MEIVVSSKNDMKQNGEILLNPGSYKLPRPQSQSIFHRYFGYIIAPDKEDAEAIFNDKTKRHTVGKRLDAEAP